MKIFPFFLCVGFLVFSTIHSHAQSIEVSRVAHEIDACPAFDIVQRRIIEVTRGAAGMEQMSDDESEPVAIEIIYDASGSMAVRLNGQPKIGIAQKALNNAVKDLDSTNALVGLRAYGFDSTVEKTEQASCPNTELVAPFRQRNSSGLSAAASNLEPYGYTPIAASLIAAGDDLRAVTARDRMVVLITDGEETCGGDPVGAARTLRENGIAVATYVVGFDLDDAQRDQMRKIARAGGGAYFDARDADGLSGALRDAVGVTVRKSERVVHKCINDVLGGHSIETATPVEPGLYTVGELLPKQTERYYFINSKKGQRVVVRGLLQSNRTFPGEDGAPFETKYALGAFTLKAYRPDGSPVRIRAARERDLPGTSFKLDFVDAQGDGVIVAVGDNYDWVAPDALFAVEIDGETGTSASAAGD